MTQKELDREVAHTTGESVEFIRSMGFSELHMPNPAPMPRGYVEQAALRIARQNNSPVDRGFRRAA